MKRGLILLLVIISLGITTASDNIFNKNLPIIKINDPNEYPTLGGNNIWTGNNSFYNYTIINYSIFDVNGTVNATQFCIGPICITDWGDVNSTTDTNETIRVDALYNNISNFVIDTNATTQCSGTNLPLGNGSCVPLADLEGGGGGSGHTHDQDLNTTNNVTFQNVTANYFCNEEGECMKINTTNSGDEITLEITI